MQEYPSRKEAEKALAILLQQSEPNVLALLYDAYAPVLLGLISRIVRNSQTAESVLQETFVAIWQQRATYNPALTGLLTWMIMLAKESALKALPTSNFSSGLSQEHLPGSVALPEPALNPPPTKAPETNAPLNTQEKAVLDLIYLKGCSSAEAAASLGISEEDLKIKLRQAINHLRANQS
ncbi:hypothetical protein HUW51_01775 [Adhaeribacter swui]|uniref:Sigma-70 family RNA polymerase sigma factor n=1 Tax=Adhaeribacter swui TaxID=2086471 RepID=A0A7G7G2X9_9BACT|nr:sigma factor [Adhaeribacter swui]QNF31513.1 hypothetical protein HUW51_01775 [Adhaeribacter swui]